MRLRFALGIAASVIAATIISALPAVILIAPEFGPELWLATAGKFIILALVGNALIGLPLGLAALAALKSQNWVNLPSLLPFANVSAGIIAVLSFASAGSFGAFFLGGPAIIAANCLAIFGWFLAIKPSIRAAA